MNNFFMELEKGDGVSLHCCTVQHVWLHTPILNCNVIYAVLRDIKIPKHVAEVCYLSLNWF